MAKWNSGEGEEGRDKEVEEEDELGGNLFKKVCRPLKCHSNVFDGQIHIYIESSCQK